MCVGAQLPPFVGAIHYGLPLHVGLKVVVIVINHDKFVVLKEGNIVKLEPKAKAANPTSKVPGVCSSSFVCLIRLSSLMLELRLATSTISIPNLEKLKPELVVTF